MEKPELTPPQSILTHYNSNVNDTIEGPELHAFVGDIARYLGLKLSLGVIEAGVTQVKVRQKPHIWSHLTVGQYRCRIT